MFKKLLSSPLRARQRDLQKGRLNYTFENFITELASSDLEKQVAALLWNYLRNDSEIEDFRPQPSDDLRYVYGIAEEELDEDLLGYLSGEVNIVLDVEHAKRFGRVRTVRDVVALISSATAKC